MEEEKIRKVMELFQLAMQRKSSNWGRHEVFTTLAGIVLGVFEVDVLSDYDPKSVTPSPVRPSAEA